MEPAYETTRKNVLFTFICLVLFSCIKKCQYQSGGIYSLVQRIQEEKDNPQQESGWGTSLRQQNTPCITLQKRHGLRDNGEVPFSVGLIPPQVSRVSYPFVAAATSLTVGHLLLMQVRGDSESRDSLVWVKCQHLVLHTLPSQVPLTALDDEALWGKGSWVLLHLTPSHPLEAAQSGQRFCPTGQLPSFHRREAFDETSLQRYSQHSTCPLVCVVCVCVDCRRTLGI